MVAYLKHLQGYQRVVMIGDGVTDLEACPPAVSHELTVSIELHFGPNFYDF